MSLVNSYSGPKDSFSSETGQFSNINYVIIS